MTEILYSTFLNDVDWTALKWLFTIEGVVGV